MTAQTKVDFALRVKSLDLNDRQVKSDLLAKESLFNKQSQGLSVVCLFQYTQATHNSIFGRAGQVQIEFSVE